MKNLIYILISLALIIAGCTSGPANDTTGSPKGSIMIEKIGSFDFNVSDIKTIRPDIFVDGQFSVFDILAHLDDQGLIDMEYEFDQTMNTHVIESINGESDWWHMVYYDGGWPENNVFRMDHYPYKQKMYIRVMKEDKPMLDEMYDIFSKEVMRKEQNNEKVIIPEVIIKGPKTNIRLNNVEVEAHDLRNDTFQKGVITAIDVIMSLQDQKELSYDLQWYESIGSARIVKSYWVERINEDQAHGRCGFVYEAGSKQYSGFRGNHIHLPSDSRVLNSPEYVEFFWICL